MERSTAGGHVYFPGNLCLQLMGLDYCTVAVFVALQEKQSFYKGVYNNDPRVVLLKFSAVLRDLNTIGEQIPIRIFTMEWIPVLLQALKLHSSKFLLILQGKVGYFSI